MARVRVLSRGLWFAQLSSGGNGTTSAESAALLRRWAGRPRIARPAGRMDHVAAWNGQLTRPALPARWAGEMN